MRDVASQVTGLLDFQVIRNGEELNQLFTIRLIYTDSFACDLARPQG
jgi:hypothetical protein